MKIKKLKIEKLIRVINIVDTGLLGDEYKNKIFVVNENGFVDWLNGREGEFIKPLSAVVSEELKEGYSTGSGRDITTSNAEYVKTLITARLLIQKGELNYQLENTSEVGLESWFKKRPAEVDLILKNMIGQTPGVRGIKSFKSSVNSNREYSCEVEIVCEGGEIIWQSIEI